MRRFMILAPLCALLMLGCGERQQRPAAAADTAQERADTTALFRPSAADTQDGAGLTDTLQRTRPTGLQRPEDATPPEGARRDSAHQPER